MLLKKVLPKDRNRIIAWSNKGKDSNFIIPKMKHRYTRQQIAGVIAWIKIRESKG